MKLGKMRYRAEFQKYTSEKDKDGFLSKRWETVFSVWADVTAVSSREYLAADTETAETTVKIYVRYNPKIDNTMRIVSGGRCYEITSVLNDRRNDITTVMAKEWSNGKVQCEAPRGDAAEALKAREEH
ncbi:MAG: phage head closure protein [Lachnospiraceae bacterium]|nr:phage head closure protein [Ruminococcus sp.]MCM1276336.1 phage head closure protein [Lachnospiraceae bacterium]